MTSAQIDFHGGGAFYTDLKVRVRAHLDHPGRRRWAERRIYAKSVVVIGWAAASWALLVFAASAWWQVAALVVSLGLAVAGIGFNITHDANHGAFSSNRRLNAAMRWSIDLIGASSYVWRVKHNVVHHTFTNISGADADIEQLPLARLAPDQRRRWFHRYQHVYVWPFYGLFTVKWHTVGDLRMLAAGRIGETALARPRGRELAGFVVGKLAFITWTIAIPALLHPLWQVAVVFVLVQLVLAFTLAVVFQLAHCLEEAAFSSVDEMGRAGRREWARHQVETTVDFAAGSRLLTWYLGGLNFQIEHHLFSRVCHVHYPSLARVVRETCEAHGVRYQSHRTLWGALGSHTRWLRRMGEPVPAVSAAAVPAG